MGIWRRRFRARRHETRASRAKDPFTPPRDRTGCPRSRGRSPSARPDGRRSLRARRRARAPARDPGRGSTAARSDPRAPATVVQPERRAIVVALQALAFSLPPVVERNVERISQKWRARARSSAGNSISSSGMAVDDTASRHVTPPRAGEVDRSPGEPAVCDDRSRSSWGILPRGGIDGVSPPKDNGPWLRSLHQTPGWLTPSGGLITSSIGTPARGLRRGPAALLHSRSSLRGWAALHRVGESACCGSAG